jgi:hypothetical protein
MDSRTIARGAACVAVSLAAMCLAVPAGAAPEAPEAAAAAAAYTVKVKAPKTALVGAKVKVVATVTAKGKAAAGLKVELQRKTAGVAWHTVKTVTTSKSGKATLTTAFHQKSLFRARVLATQGAKAVTSKPATTQVKGNADVRAIVALLSKACLTHVNKYFAGQMEDMTALTGVGDTESLKFDGEYALATSAGCGSTNKTDQMKTGGGAASLLQKTGGAWKQVFTFQQVMCDEVDGKGYPLSLIPVCNTAAGTERAPNP